MVEEVVDDAGGLFDRAEQVRQLEYAHLGNDVGDGARRDADSLVGSVLALTHERQLTVRATQKDAYPQPAVRLPLEALVELLELLRPGGVVGSDRPDVEGELRLGVLSHRWHRNHEHCGCYE